MRCCVGTRPLLRFPASDFCEFEQMSSKIKLVVGMPDEDMGTFLPTRSGRPAISTKRSRRIMSDITDSPRFRERAAMCGRSEDPKELRVALIGWEDDLTVRAIASLVATLATLTLSAFLS